MSVAAHPSLVVAWTSRDGSTNAKGKAMSDNVDFTAMSDPDFLAERTRVRAELTELTELFERLNEEFDRRARAEWSRAS
jgi:hypothetical protein